MASRTLGAAAVLGLLALIAGCGKTPAHKPTPEAGPTVRAKTETVAKQALGADYEAVGAVRSKTVSTIQSQVVEPVKAVHVKEGDRVEAGALLVELDDREISTQARKAESGLKEAQSALEEIGKSINAAESAKAAADANSALAKATFERYKGLADSQAVSRQMFDEAAARHKAASAQAAQAADMVRSVQAKRGEVEARLEQAKAAIENARVLLSYTKILAPIAGLVTMKNVDVGDLASPNVALLTIEDDQRYRMEAMVDEAHVGRLQTGQQASVTIDALGGKALTGTISDIVPTADPASRSFLVKVDLPQTESLRSGMFGRVAFGMAERQALTIPRMAVIERGQLTSVYVVTPEGIGLGRARLRLIKTGKTYGDRLEVLSGLNEGETVVTEGADRVTDGAAMDGARIEREP